MKTKVKINLETKEKPWIISLKYSRLQNWHVRVFYKLKLFRTFTTILTVSEENYTLQTTPLPGSC